MTEQSRAARAPRRTGPTPPTRQEHSGSRWWPHRPQLVATVPPTLACVNGVVRPWPHKKRSTVGIAANAARACCGPLVSSTISRAWPSPLPGPTEESA